MSLVDAIPALWRQSLKINGYLNKSPFVIQDQIELVLIKQEGSITEASFKKVYRETAIATPPTAHSKFNEASVASVWTGGNSQFVISSRFRHKVTRISI